VQLHHVFYKHLAKTVVQGIKIMSVVLWKMQLTLDLFVYPKYGVRFVTINCQGTCRFHVTGRASRFCNDRSLGR
jgi:hypothetical protein